jgi:hypothetical protein
MRALPPITSGLRGGAYAVNDCGQGVGFSFNFYVPRATTWYRYVVDLATVGSPEEDPALLYIMPGDFSKWLDRRVSSPRCRVCVQRRNLRDSVTGKVEIRLENRSKKPIVNIPRNERLTRLY